MTRIGIVIGSTRPGRRGAAVGHWVHEVAVTYRPATACEVLDLADFGLPLLYEPCPAAMGEYRHRHARVWARTVASCDGFVFVTPKDNHSTSAALKNSIDCLFAELHDKGVGFVRYGVTGGWRAVEALRLVLAEVRVADVRTSVGLSLFTDSTANDPTPAAHQRGRSHTMLDELLTWSATLAQVRQP